MFINKLNSRYLFLLLLFIIAIFLRIYHLNFQSLWLDEIYSIIPTSSENTIASIIEYCKGDQPPAYFLLLHFWFKLFPYESYSARALSAIIGVLGVVAMFFLGKECKDWNTGLIAALLTAVNYYHIVYSQEVRFYSLLFLTTTLSYLFFLRILKNRHPLDFFFYFIFSVINCYTQYYGILAIVTQYFILIPIFILDKCRWKLLIKFAICGILILACYTPWIPTILNEAEVTNTWLTRPNKFFVFVYLYLYFGKDPVSVAIFIAASVIFLLAFFKMVTTPSQAKKYLIGVILAFIILFCSLMFLVPLLFKGYTGKVDFNVFLAILYSLIILFLFTTIAFVIRKIIRVDYKLKFNSYLFLTITYSVVLLYMIPYIRSIISTPMLLSRYTIVALPLLLLTMGIGISYIPNQQLKTLSVLIVIISTVLNLAFFNKYYTKIIKTQWRETASYVVCNNNEGYPIYSNMDWWYNYYFRLFNSRQLAVNPTNINFENEIQGKRKIWVVQAHEGRGLSDTHFEYLLNNYDILDQVNYKGAYAILFEIKE